MNALKLNQRTKYQCFIDSVSVLREKLSNIQTEITKDDLQIIKEHLNDFRCFKTVEIFLEDCENSAGNVLDFSRTRSFVFDKTEPIVLSVFDVPYNKKLTLDALVYEEEFPDPYFKENYPYSMATSVNIIACTEGFDQYPGCVALFPENFCAVGDFGKSFSVFYFINVFLRRFDEFGKLILDNFVSAKSFWRIKRLSIKTLKTAFSTWFYLHEYFHSQGLLPYNEYFKIKNTKNTAALEELRVDVLSILSCLKATKEGYGDAYFYAELILFERLLRYSAHSDPEDNYDARGSLIFMNFLEEHMAVSVNEDGILDLKKSRIEDSLQAYVTFLEELEKEIKKGLQGRSSREIDFKKERLPLTNFANRYSGDGGIVKNPYLQKIYLSATNLATR